MVDASASSVGLSKEIKNHCKSVRIRATKSRNRNVFILLTLLSFVRWFSSWEILNEKQPIHLSACTSFTLTNVGAVSVVNNLFCRRSHLGPDTRCFSPIILFFILHFSTSPLVATKCSVALCAASPNERQFIDRFRNSHRECKRAYNSITIFEGNCNCEIASLGSVGLRWRILSLH